MAVKSYSGPVQQSLLTSWFTATMDTFYPLVGWTKVGGIYTAPASAGFGVLLAINSTNYVTFYCYDSASSYHQLSAYHGCTSTSGNLQVELHVGTDFFFFSIEGPDNTETGRYNATYGSPKQSILVTTFDPYDPNDVTDSVVTVSGTVNGTSQLDNAKTMWGKTVLDSKVQPGYFATVNPPALAAGEYNAIAADGLQLLPVELVQPGTGVRGRVNNVLLPAASELLHWPADYQYKDPSDQNWKAHDWSKVINSNYNDTPWGPDTARTYNAWVNAQGSPWIYIPEE